MCRKTEADLCCIYVFMMFHFYIGIYHKKIYLFFFVSWALWIGLWVWKHSWCVCVIALQVDLEQLWNAVGSLITPLEEFICCTEWTFLWLTVQICSPPPSVFALCRTLCQFALERWGPAWLFTLVWNLGGGVLGFAWHRALQIESLLTSSKLIFEQFDANVTTRFECFPPRV